MFLKIIIITITETEKFQTASKKDRHTYKGDTVINSPLTIKGLS